LEMGGGHGGGITSNLVQEGAERFAARFVKFSAVCCCGELNLHCMMPLQHCGGHTEAVEHPAGIHKLSHQWWDLLSRDPHVASET